LLGTGCWLLERERLKAEGLTIGDSFDWGFQIADFGFIKRIEFLFYREKPAMRWKAEGERLFDWGFRSADLGFVKGLLSNFYRDQ